MKVFRLKWVRAAIAGLTASLLLAACQPETSTVPPATMRELIAIDFAQKEMSYSGRSVAAVDDDAAIVGDDFGTADFFSTYRFLRGHWRFMAQKLGSPEPCLFADADIGMPRAQRLADRAWRELLAESAKYDSSRTVMSNDDRNPLTCRGGPDWKNAGYGPWAPDKSATYDATVRAILTVWNSHPHTQSPYRVGAESVWIQNDSAVVLSNVPAPMPATIAVLRHKKGVWSITASSSTALLDCLFLAGHIPERDADFLDLFARKEQDLRLSNQLRDDYSCDRTEK